MPLLLFTMILLAAPLLPRIALFDISTCLASFHMLWRALMLRVIDNPAHINTYFYRRHCCHAVLLCRYAAMRSCLSLCYAARYLISRDARRFEPLFTLIPTLLSFMPYCSCVYAYARPPPPESSYAAMMSCHRRFRQMPFSLFRGNKCLISRCCRLPAA